VAPQNQSRRCCLNGGGNATTYYTVVLRPWRRGDGDWFHGWLITAAVIVLLFGHGEVSELMGDIGRGIASFRQRLAGLLTSRPRPDAAQGPEWVIPLRLLRGTNRPEHVMKLR
jgi:TatA/E family protein of Tat protein translocase